MARILPGVGNLYKEARTATGAPTVFDERKPYINETREAIERAWAQPEVVGKMLDIAAGTGKTFYDKYNRVQEAKAQVIAQRRKTGQTQKPDPTGMFSLGGVTPQELQAAGVDTMQQAAADAAGARTYGEREAAMRMAERAYDRPGTYSFMDEMVGGPDTRRRELIKKLYPPLQKATGGRGGAASRYKLNLERDPKRWGDKELGDRARDLRERKEFREKGEASGLGFNLSRRDFEEIFRNLRVEGDSVYVYGTPEEQSAVVKAMVERPSEARVLVENLIGRTRAIQSASAADQQDLSLLESQIDFQNKYLEPFYSLGQMTFNSNQEYQDMQRAHVLAQQIYATSIDQGFDPLTHPQFPEFFQLTRRLQSLPGLQRSETPKQGPNPGAADKLKNDAKARGGATQQQEDPDDQPADDSFIDEVFGASREEKTKPQKREKPNLDELLKGLELPER